MRSKNRKPCKIERERERERERHRERQGDGKKVYNVPDLSHMDASRSISILNLKENRYKFLNAISTPFIRFNYIFNGKYFRLPFYDPS